MVMGGGGGLAVIMWVFRINCGTLTVFKPPTSTTKKYLHVIFSFQYELLFISVSSHIHMFYNQYYTKGHDLTVI